MISTPLQDEYEIGEVLGVGTVGTIYRAVDRRTAEAVAIKKLHPNVSADRLIRARFRREMLIMDRLHHPNIMRYLGGGEDSDGLLYYVMELVEGGTIKQLLESNGPLPWPAVAEIGCQLCSALQFAHNHGVIHRDIKPSNLFLTKTGQVKLGDFGIARDVQDADITSSGMTVGTHAYMAPEQIRGDEAISGKADLYSLGCCFYEMLTGQTPFVGEHFAELFDQHLSADPPQVVTLLPECPRPLNDVVDRMLAKRPEDRPFNARQIQAVMLNLNAGQADKLSLADDQAAEQGDVGSNEVKSRGREMLRARIRQHAAGSADQHVSWTRLVVVFGVIVAAIAIAMLMRS